MSLYQKYRPRDFNSLIWQEFVKISLSNALSSWKIVWAYLFYGSRGTGKTTTARILARTLNCLNPKKDWNPCLECENCMAFDRWELIDIIEIDAASNTWVDNIRELIEKAQFQPTQARFKVYIIDEVHMLSKWAFNALLKILEEPPSHVKFILATTEIQKIPETIISRTQRYDFKKITDQDIVDRLQHIAVSEWILAENKALELIARLSRWWLRDAISLFEQYSIWQKLKLDYLMDNLQLVWDEFLTNFLKNLLSKDLNKIKNDIDFLREKGIDVRNFIEEFSFFIRNTILENNIENSSEYLKIFLLLDDIYSKIKFVPNTFLSFEISIYSYLVDENFINNSLDNETVISNIKKSLEKKEKPKQKVEDFWDIFSENIKLEDNDSDKKSPEINDENIDYSSFDFTKLVEEVKKDSWKWFVAMSLKSCSYNISWNNLNLNANNKFNYDKLSTPEIKMYLIEKIQNIFWFSLDVFVFESENNNNFINQSVWVF